MIDLHFHILPGIDDGPETMEAAVALARIAERAGTRTVVATSHVSFRYPNRASKIDELVGELNARLADARIPLDIRPGAEIAATSVPEIDPADLARMTLGDGPWLLLEPPFTPVAAGFDELAYSLMRDGHRIVIAHPERCPSFHRDFAMLERLVGAGALTSVTAGSLVGRFGKQVRRFSMQMFDGHLVHNVASDAHDELSRPPGMAAEIEHAGFGALRQWLTEEVPAAILDGESIPPRPLAAQPRRRGLVARIRGG